MNTSTAQDSWELKDYVRVLRRRWLIVVGLTILGGLIGGIALKLAPKKYTSTASVYVQGLPTDALVQGGGAASVDMDSEAQLVQAPAEHNSPPRDCDPQRPQRS